MRDEQEVGTMKCRTVLSLSFQFPEKGRKNSFRFSDRRFVFSEN
jgi:hypothetical protein